MSNGAHACMSISTHWRIWLRLQSSDRWYIWFSKIFQYSYSGQGNRIIDIFFNKDDQREWKFIACHVCILSLDAASTKAYLYETWIIVEWLELINNKEIPSCYNFYQSLANKLIKTFSGRSSWSWYLPWTKSLTFEYNVVGDVIIEVLHNSIGQNLHFLFSLSKKRN